MYRARCFRRTNFSARINEDERDRSSSSSFDNTTRNHFEPALRLPVPLACNDLYSPGKTGHMHAPSQSLATLGQCRLRTMLNFFRLPLTSSDYVAAISACQSMEYQQRNIAALEHLAGLTLE